MQQGNPIRSEFFVKRTRCEFANKVRSSDSTSISRNYCTEKQTISLSRDGNIISGKTAL